MPDRANAGRGGAPIGKASEAWAGAQDSMTTANFQTVAAPRPVKPETPPPPTSSEQPKPAK